MNDNDQTRKKEKLDYIEEGRKLKQKQEEESKKIAEIQKKKVQKMEVMGTESKFHTQLGKKTFVPQ